MSINYSEQIFQSIDKIISQRLNEVSFDKTEICKIVSQNQDQSDRYWVTNEAGLKYEAYTTDPNRKYIEGQKVYVTVPQGNYGYRKLIIGSYSADEIPKKLYTNPFSNFAPNNSISFDLGTGLVVKTNSNDIEPAVKITQFSYNNTQDFNYIGLDFSFDTLEVSGFKGTYYLKLSLWGDTRAETNRLTNEYDLILSSQNLYGNPYNLTEHLSFQHLFPWPTNASNKKLVKPTDIKAIKLEFFADKKFEVSGESIILKKAVLKFGYDVSEINEDKLELILEEGQNIKYNVKSDEENSRTLHLNWKHFDSSNKLYIFNENQPLSDNSIFDGTPKFYWLHYVDGTGSSDTGLNDDIAWNWQKCVSYNTTNENENIFDQTIKLVKLYPNDQYKAVIKYKHMGDTEFSYAISNAIVFESATAKASPGAGNVSGDTLKLTLGDGDTGIYNAYGLDGVMVNTHLKGPHTITASFFDGMTWNDVKSAEWKVPSTNTMIESYTVVEGSKKEKIQFNIKSSYRPGAMDNRIQCIATLNNGEVRSGSLTLQFGEVSTSGSTYSLNIDFVGNKNFLFYNKGIGENADSVQIKATFTKSDGSEVTTKPEISWSWVNSDAEGETYHRNFDSVEVDYVSISNVSDTTYECTLVAKTDPAISAYWLEHYCGILKATINDYNLENGIQANLVAYLSVPLVYLGETDDITKNYFEYISGPTRVVYDFDNKGFTLSNESYGLYTANNRTESYGNTVWYLNSYSNNGIPKLRGTEYKANGFTYYETGCSLKPVSYEVQEIPKINISAYYKNSVAKNKNLIYWCQPILIMSNRWGSDVINDWDGTIKIDEDAKNGGIKSPFFIAGRKENDSAAGGNVLTGLAIGDLTKAGVSQGTGIYGFNKGKVRYSLTDQGNFYVGSENGHINFTNGNLDIKSQNFDLEAGTGDNKLVINNTSGIALGNKIKINKGGTATIGGWDIKEAYIENKKENDKWFYINSKPGTSGYYDSWIAAGKYNTTSKKWEWPFYVEKNGILHATGADITGKITATEGEIGGATINSEGVLQIKRVNIAEKLTAEEINVTGIITAGSATIKGIVQATEISASKITAGTTSATITMSGDVTISGKLTVNGSGTIAGCTINSSGNLIIPSGQVSGDFYTNSLYIRTYSNNNWKYYAKLLTNGHIEFTNGSGFFTMGPANGTSTVSTTHPYVSALNVASGSGGIVFLSGKNINDKGENLGYLSPSSSNGEYIINFGVNNNSRGGRIDITAYKLRIKSLQYDATKFYTGISGVYDMESSSGTPKLTIVNGLVVGYESN